MTDFGYGICNKGYIEGPVTIRTILTCTLLVFAVAATPQDLDEGRQAYESGDYETALRILRPLAEQRNSEAQYQIGWVFQPYDWSKAVYWWRHAAEQGHAKAQDAMGMAYNYGFGVQQNDREATKWYRMAAEQGYSDAQYSLGEAYGLGKGVTKDPAEALNWYRLWAIQDDAIAKYGLGVRLKSGIVVPQDQVEAVKWFRRAAELGHIYAQYDLGVAYFTGEGVPRDHVEAAKWYRRAAEQGHASAQYNIGIAYDLGLGMPQNHVEAVRWFRAAADQSHAFAQYKLGFAYASSQGVHQDIVYAHVWSNLAAAQGNESSKIMRDDLQSRMSREQVAEAQQIASSWQPGSPLGLGEGVSFIQRALWKLGHSPGTIDGRIGLRTRSAIRAFQQEQGLPVDGEVSAKLVQALRYALADQAIEDAVLEDASDMH